MNKRLILLALCLAGVSLSAFAAVCELPADGATVVGIDSRIKLSDQEKLFDVARRYGPGYPEIVRANPGADFWSSGENQAILLPIRRILPPTPTKASWLIRRSIGCITTRCLRPERSGS
jgi:hypothetical protein